MQTNEFEPWTARVPRTWDEMLKRSRRCLSYWDRWCPDDPRPALALKAAIAYHDEPTTERYAELERVSVTLVVALNMARNAVPPIKADETVAQQIARQKTPEAMAIAGGRVIGLLAAGELLDPTSRVLLWDTAIELSGTLNLIDVIFLGSDVDEDEE